MIKCFVQSESMYIHTIYVIKLVLFHLVLHITPFMVDVLCLAGKVSMWPKEMLREGPKQF